MTRGYFKKNHKTFLICPIPSTPLKAAACFVQRVCDLYPSAVLFFTLSMRPSAPWGNRKQTNE